MVPSQWLVNHYTPIYAGRYYHKIVITRNTTMELIQAYNNYYGFIFIFFLLIIILQIVMMI